MTVAQHKAAHLGTRHHTLGGTAATPVLPSCIMAVLKLRLGFFNLYYPSGRGNLPVPFHLCLPKKGLEAAPCPSGEFEMLK